jgi:hypothetical protein
MAKVVEVQLIAKTDDAVAGVKKVDDAIKKTGNSAKKTSKDISAFSEGGKQLVSALDRQTGGLASKFVAVGKAAKLSGKAMKTALISSGIGLAVVAVGLLVEYWDEIGEALGFINKDLENQAIEINKSIDASNVKLASLKNQQTILELQDKSTTNIKNAIKEELLLQVQKNVELLKNLQTQLELEKNSQKEVGFLEKAAFWVGTRLGSTNALLFATRNIKAENEKELEIQEQINKANTQAENLKISLLQLDKKANDEKQKAADNANKAAEEAERKAKEAEKERVDAIERIRKGLIDTEAEERAEKLRLIKEDYDEQIALAAEFYGTNSIKILELKAAQKAAEDEQQAEFDKQDKERQDKLDQEEKDNKEQKLEDDKKIAKAKADLQNELTGEVANAVGAIGDIFEKGTAASKGAALAEIAIGTGMGFINALDIAQKSAKGTGPAAAFAFPIFYASQIAAVLGAVSQAKNILSTVKGGGGSGSTPTAPTGGGSAPQPPAFNIVGASGETQLADAIGSQTQRPARAYVVSNDVTTAQEMDRNIIEGASIG